MQSNSFLSGVCVGGGGGGEPYGRSGGHIFC